MKKITIFMLIILLIFLGACKKMPALPQGSGLDSSDYESSSLLDDDSDNKDNHSNIDSATKNNSKTEGNNIQNNNDNTSEKNNPPKNDNPQGGNSGQSKPVSQGTTTGNTGNLSLKIQQQPKDASQTKMNQVTFSISATGEGLKYEWQEKNQNAWTKIDSNARFVSGESTSSLKIAHFENISVRCVVTDKNGKSLTSAEARLDVNLLGSAFVIYVEDVFTVSGKKIVTGKILNGTLNKGDNIYYLGVGGNSKTMCKAMKIEMFRKEVTSASKGDNVGIELNYTGDTKRGDVLVSDSNLFPSPATGKKTVLKGTFHYKNFDGSHTPYKSPITTNHNLKAYLTTDFDVKMDFVGGAIDKGESRRNVTITPSNEDVFWLISYPGQVVAIRITSTLVGYMVVESVE